MTKIHILHCVWWERVRHFENGNLNTGWIFDESKAFCQCLVVKMVLWLWFLKDFYFFLNFLFWNNYSFTGNYKNSTKNFHVPFSFSMVTYKITIVNFQNQEIEIGLIHQPYSDVTSFLYTRVWMCACVYAFVCMCIKLYVVSLQAYICVITTVDKIQSISNISRIFPTALL